MTTTACKGPQTFKPDKIPALRMGSEQKAHPKQRSYLQLIPVGKEKNQTFFSNRMLLEILTTLQVRSWDQEYLVNTKETLWVCLVLVSVSLCVGWCTLFSCFVLLSYVDFHFLFFLFYYSRQRDGMGELNSVGRKIGKILE